MSKSIMDYSSKSRPAFPRPGESDTIPLQDVVDDENTQGKVIIKCVDRYLSLWPSQLRPIADVLLETKAKSVYVEWEADEENPNRTIIGKIEAQ